jgi:hypothetical protein
MCGSLPRSETLKEPYDYSARLLLHDETGVSSLMLQKQKILGKIARYSQLDGFLTARAGSRYWPFALGLLLAGFAAIAVAKPQKTEFVRLSKPDVLKFDELVLLEQTDEPNAKLAARLDKLLHTPFISNEAYLGGAKPNRPSSDALGPFLRATMWNIERGIYLDGIKIALTQPDKFGSYIDEKKDPKSKPLTAEQMAIVKSQLATIGPTDLFILNEVDNGVTRTACPF